MENQIYHLIDKLMEIFEVEQPSLGQRWADQLIAGARRPDRFIQSVSVSLDEIQSFRGEDTIRNLYNQIQRDGKGLRGADGVLHLASKLGKDDSIRKFIKIHNLLRSAKAKKLRQNQQQQQHQHQNNQPMQPSQSSQQIPPTMNNANPLAPHLSSMPFNQPVTSTPVRMNQNFQDQVQMKQSNGFQPPMVPPIPSSSAKTMKQIPVQHNSQQQPQMPSPSMKSLPVHQNQQLQPYETPARSNTVSRRQPQTPHQHFDLSTSMIAITPASHKTKREKKKTYSRGKNDILYQRMKSFLAENQFLSFDFKKIDWSLMGPIIPLSSMSSQDQEAALINDLLYVLLGTEGKYIRMQPSRESPNKHTIGVDRGCEELVYIMATRIIKICPLYSTVVHYAEDINFGLVNQALAAPIRDLVKEYIALISNLQMRVLRDEITLQSMWYTLQTIFNRMDALKQILDQISRESCYGGHTLTVLHNRVVNFSTEARTQDFCLKLMQAASEPYFEILERWIYLGVIDDPHGEFFIEDTENKPDAKNLFTNQIHNRANNNQNLQNIDIDTFWRKRFTRDDSKVPYFLKSKQEKIFDTGKYLSVVRQYSKKIFRPLPYEPLTYSPELREYDARIDAAYKFASKELLDLLLVENKLIDRLHSLKRYYLFSSGDFFVQFMDMADEELSKTKDDINMTRLESLLELALRTSSCNNDPYKEDLHIKMSDGNLFQIMASINNSNNVNMDQSSADYNASSGNLLGWESLSLSYDVPWPLSMIICKDYCQTLYQMMFKHLFCCKYIERKLESTWRINRLLRFDNYEGAFALRHKMLHFVHNLLFYIIEIIEPGFQILISKFNEGCIENVNEVIELHRAFLSGLVHDSMLTDNELLAHVTKLLLLCMDFSVVIEARFAAQELVQKQEQQNLSTRSRSTNNLTCTKYTNKDNETDAKSNKRPNVVVRPMTDDNSTSPGESYVASQIRKLSLSSQQSQQTNTRMQKSESIGSFKSKSKTPEEIFQARIGEINEKFNKQLLILLEAITTRSQDFTASSKLQNIFYRLDFNNFYTKRDLAA